MILLEARRLVKSFGGVTPINGVDLEVQRGELKCIIGLNGSGKTTLFNLLTGYVRCDSGQVFFNDENITRLPPRQICRKGIGRAFQVSRIFPRLTVAENVQASLLSHYRKTRDLFSSVQALFRADVLEMLDLIGLRERAGDPAGVLSRGDQKRVDIAIALAQAPELLILDEPTAGMSPEERLGTVALIRKLVERGMTILLTEHDIDLVFTVADIIVVLHGGKIICQGKPVEVRSNTEVQNIYLGEVV